MALRVTTEAEPICGSNTTFCMPRNSSGTFGSFSKTSRPAARMVPDFNAAISACSSTTEPRATLINVARGSVVDEQALIAALKSGTILAAGLDVFEKEPNVPDELRGMQNVVLLPHIGSASVVTRNAMDQLVVDNLKAWFAGKPPLTPVAETPVKGR